MFILMCFVLTTKVYSVIVITIKSDGSISPSTAPIYRNGTSYIFKSNIKGYIIVERDNIVIDGEGFTLKVSSACPVYKRNGIILSGRRNVTVKDMQIDMAWYGILVENCSNITISRVVITKSLHGIHLSNSSNNGIIESTVTSNYHDGIQVYSSTTNRIKRNIIQNNKEEGITLELSVNNIISENVIKNNLDGIVLIESSHNYIISNNITTNTDTGIWVLSSSENIIYHNNFIDNPVQIYTFNSNNVWDDSFVGNYWSNYEGFDGNGDGIGDIPYVIGKYNQDRYPLMDPYVIPELPNSFLLILLVGATLGIAIRRRFL